MKLPFMPLKSKETYCPIGLVTHDKYIVNVWRQSATQMVGANTKMLKN